MALDPVTAVSNVIGSVINKIWPDATAAEQAKLAALQTVMASELAIHETNTAEAGNASVFVAGWRPFIGWVCGTGVAYTFLLQPFLAWLSTIANVPVPPVLDTAPLMSLVMTMLGFAGFRTYEKMQGVDRSVLNVFKKKVSE